MLYKTDSTYVGGVQLLFDYYGVVMCDSASGKMVDLEESARLGGWVFRRDALLMLSMPHGCCGCVVASSVVDGAEENYLTHMLCTGIVVEYVCFGRRTFARSSFLIFGELATHSCSCPGNCECWAAMRVLKNVRNYGDRDPKYDFLYGELPPFYPRGDGERICRVDQKENY